MTAKLGSLRQVTTTGAEVVTNCGVYLTFRLEPDKRPEVRYLREIGRRRAFPNPLQQVLLDAYVYTRVRRGVVAAIAAHRARMRLPETRVLRRSPRQLRFEF